MLICEPTPLTLMQIPQPRWNNWFPGTESPLGATHNKGCFPTLSSTLPATLKLAALPSSCGFPGGTRGKEPSCQCRRRERCRFCPRVRKIPCRRAWQPTPIFLPGESRGQRSLVATVHRVAESDLTEATQHSTQHKHGYFPDFPPFPSHLTYKSLYSSILNPYQWLYQASESSWSHRMSKHASSVFSQFCL